MSESSLVLLQCQPKHFFPDHPDCWHPREKVFSQQTYEGCLGISFCCRLSNDHSGHHQSLQVSHHSDFLSAWCFWLQMSATTTRHLLSQVECTARTGKRCCWCGCSVCSHLCWAVDRTSLWLWLLMGSLNYLEERNMLCAFKPSSGCCVQAPAAGSP